MEWIKANAALAEMKGINDSLMQRIVTLASELAVAQHQLMEYAKRQKKKKPQPKPPQ